MQLSEYARGEMLFWEDDPCAGLHIINLGSAKILRFSPQGWQYIMRILQEGDTFAEVPALYQVTHQLVRLISEHGEKPRPHWTQEQLAEQLGTVREVVARSLQELERSGAIRIEDRRIHIVDSKVLRQWTQPN